MLISQGAGSLAQFLLATPLALNASPIYRMNVDGVRDGAATLPASCDPFIKQRRAYVANKPLQSVGELGYLPIARWLTLTLYDHGHTTIHTDSLGLFGGGPLLPAHGYHKVLDYFTIKTNSTVLRGRVNLNTRAPSVLAAVLNDLPLLTDDTTSATIPRIQMTGASTTLANLIIQNGSYTNLSDLGRIYKGVAALGANTLVNPVLPDPMSAISGPCTTGFGEFEREAVIRNACNLLTTRQQIFTIIMRADSFVPRFGFSDIKQGNVLATAHAVVQIWRDPVATDYGGGVKKHKCYVQLFKLLDE